MGMIALADGSASRRPLYEPKGVGVVGEAGAHAPISLASPVSAASYDGWVVDGTCGCA